MARGPRYCVHTRRRREGKTDYKARKILALSRKPRLVARNTLKHVIAQIIVAKPHGDEVLASAHSNELKKKYGWKAYAGNVPSAYLTGLLCGLRAKVVGVNECILDIGLVSPTKGRKVFATLKGVVDAGIKANYSEEKIVEERIKGKHIAEYAINLKVGSESYVSKFSKYLEKGMSPEKLPEHFTEVKTDIVNTFKTGGKKA